MVQHRCHTVTFFRRHEFSLKYSLLITSLYQNHQNDNQIVYRFYMQTLLPIHDLCTFKKWHLLVIYYSPLSKQLCRRDHLEASSSSLPGPGQQRSRESWELQSLNWNDPGYFWWYQYPLACEQIWVICYCWGNSSMVEGRFSKWF